MLAATKRDLSTPEVAETLTDAAQQHLEKQGAPDEDVTKLKDALTADPRRILDGDVNVSDIGPTDRRGFEVAFAAIDESQVEARRIRELRMSQATKTFNAALALVVLGVLLIFGGVALLLFRGDISTAALSAGVGALTEVVSAVLFKFNSDAQGRLSAVESDLSYLYAARVALAATQLIEEPAKRDDSVREVLRGLQHARDPYGAGTRGPEP
jgi:hypothetical protein